MPLIDTRIVPSETWAFVGVGRMLGVLTGVSLGEEALGVDNGSCEITGAVGIGANSGSFVIVVAQAHSNAMPTTVSPDPPNLINDANCAPI